MNPLEDIVSSLTKSRAMNSLNDARKGAQDWKSYHRAVMKSKASASGTGFGVTKSPMDWAKSSGSAFLQVPPVSRVSSVDTVMSPDFRARPRKRTFGTIEEEAHLQSRPISRFVFQPMTTEEFIAKLRVENEALERRKQQTIKPFVMDTSHEAMLRKTYAVSEEFRSRLEWMSYDVSSTNPNWILNIALRDGWVLACANLKRLNDDVYNDVLYYDNEDAILMELKPLRFEPFYTKNNARQIEQLNHLWTEMMRMINFISQQVCYDSLTHESSKFVLQSKIQDLEKSVFEFTYNASVFFKRMQQDVNLYRLAMHVEVFNTRRQMVFLMLLCVFGKDKRELKDYLDGLIVTLGAPVKTSSDSIQIDWQNVRTLIEAEFDSSDQLHDPYKSYIVRIGKAIESTKPSMSLTELTGQAYAQSSLINTSNDKTMIVDASLESLKQYMECCASDTDLSSIETNVSKWMKINRVTKLLGPLQEVVGDKDDGRNLWVY